MREFFAKMFRWFLIIHLCISIDMAIMGQLLNPEAHLRYTSFWGPVLLSALCVLPSLVRYSRHELSVREMFFRRVLQVLLIEGIVLGFLYFSVPLRDVSAAIKVAVSVLIVYGAVCLIDWAQGKMDADAMNRKLLELKKDFYKKG